MFWYIACFVDEDGIFRDIGVVETPRGLPLYIHLDKSRGLQMTDIVDLKMSGAESFSFGGYVYQAVTMANPRGGGIIFMSDAPVRAKIFESVLTQMDIGLQIFDSQSRLVFLNDTCQRIESLIRENVLGKRLQEIYTVDEDYSTILTTMRDRKPVRGRCDVFGNRFGDEVISINSGFPLYVDGRFYGAYGLVMDQQTLSAYSQQLDILNQFLRGASEINTPRYDIIDRLYIFSDIIGESTSLRETVQVAAKVASSNLSVMLLGKTGTGKEMFAQSIHSSSPRRGKNFVGINCAAIPSSIIESTLFGTVKGAFTGSGNQQGLLDEAAGGTLFLDEINSMDFHVQSKLLRVLQEKKFRRVGGLKDIECDFRVIAAMNEAPAEAIAARRLRQDLLFRLNTVTIEIPPLRERREDILVLVEHYLHNPTRLSHRASGLTHAARALLLGYDWPGNVRELLHTLDYASTMAGGGGRILDEKHFPSHLVRDTAVSDSSSPAEPAATPPPDERKKNLHLGLNELLQAQEKLLIETALRDNDNNISLAAKVLKLSRQALQHRMKKLGLRGAS